jgi:anthranilate synthase component 2
MRVLIIDNYDSFVYNIVQMVSQTTAADVDVVRNDDPRLMSLTATDYGAVIISPGPDLPEAAGKLMEFIGRWHASVPMLGVCLGFQAIACFFGAKLLNLATPLHGHESVLTGVDGQDVLYRGIDRPISVGHYHSWVVDESALPQCLHPTAYDADGHLMSFSHLTLPIYGVQYHPESIITTCGRSIIENFLRVCG